MQCTPGASRCSMKKFDIFFIDLDNTLVPHGRNEASERNIRALKAAKEKGISLCVATGRCRGLMPPAVREVGFDYALTANGCALYDLRDEKCVLRCGFSQEIAEKAYEIIRPELDFFELFVGGEIMVDRGEVDKINRMPLPKTHFEYFSWGKGIFDQSFEEYIHSGAETLEKFNCIVTPPPAMKKLRPLLESTGLYEVTAIESKGVLEVLPKGCTKGQMIRDFCRLKGIKLESCAAFGDGDNDIDMLQTAGTGVAMGSADASVKAIADAVTGSVEEDGLAAFIEKEIL